MFKHRLRQKVNAKKASRRIGGRHIDRDRVPSSLNEVSDDVPLIRPGSRRGLNPITPANHGGQGELERAGNRFHRKPQRASRILWMRAGKKLLIVRQPIAVRIKLDTSLFDAALAKLE